MKHLTWFGLSVFAIASGCSVDHETQLTVAISSEAEVPTELSEFNVKITSTRTGEIRLQQPYPVVNGKDFPSTLAIIPADEDSIKSPLKIEVTALKGTDIILTRTSIVSYIEGRNLMVSVPLRMACFNFKTCEEGSTCVGGQCTPAKVEPDTLVDYQAKYISPDTAGCFDEEKCLAAKTEVTVAEDCTFPIATGEPVNVAIRWAAASQRLLTLESGDKREGWTRLAADRGQLSTGACDSHFQRKDENGNLKVADWAKKVYVATGCEAKSTLVPYCRSAVTGTSGIGASSPDDPK